MSFSTNPNVKFKICKHSPIYKSVQSQLLVAFFLFLKNRFWPYLFCFELVLSKKVGKKFIKRRLELLYHFFFWRDIVCSALNPAEKKRFLLIFADLLCVLCEYYYHFLMKKKNRYRLTHLWENVVLAKDMLNWKKNIYIIRDIAHDGF